MAHALTDELKIKGVAKAAWDAAPFFFYSD
jgi:hypothetical protein